MTQTFNIHMRRTWEERVAFTVEAASVEEAIKKAYEEVDDVDFNWNNVEQSDHEVMFVEDLEGKELYALDSHEAETNMGTAREPSVDAALMPAK
jgi:hypothetical protein